MTSRPGIYLISAIILIIVCSFFGGVYADEPVTSSHQDSPWQGTWTDANYSLTLSQNGSVINGIATVSDPGVVVMPFRLTGTLSEDGRTLQSVLTETGTLTMNLSEDKMMFYGTGSTDSLDTGTELFSYTFNATRNGTTVISDQEWTGIWVSNNSLLNLTQNTTSVTGDYHLLNALHYGGLLQGTTSADKKTASMTWISPENDSFSLSDDRMNIIEGECTDEKINAMGYCLNLTKKV